MENEIGGGVFENKCTLHDGTAVLLRVIVADNLASIAGEALRKVVGGEVGIGDGRDRHRDTVSVSVQRATGYVPILRPLLLQI